VSTPHWKKEEIKVMEKELIALLKEKSVGKATWYVEGTDFSVYIWRKHLYVIDEDSMDRAFEDLSEEQKTTLQAGIMKGTLIKA
jgi:hypothetical protein